MDYEAAGLRDGHEPIIAVQHLERRGARGGRGSGHAYQDRAPVGDSTTSERSVREESRRAPWARAEARTLGVLGTRVEKGVIAAGPPGGTRGAAIETRGAHREDETAVERGVARQDGPPQPVLDAWLDAGGLGGEGGRARAHRGRSLRG
jgi:hypothetical protein